MALPNWAAKFFVEALLQKKEMLDCLELPASVPCTPPGPLPVAAAAPASDKTESSSQVRVAVYAPPGSEKARQVVEKLTARGWDPNLMVIEEHEDPPGWRRLLDRIHLEGIAWIPENPARLLARWLPSTDPDRAPDLPEICCRRGVKLVRVGPLVETKSVDRVRRLSPDLAIYATRGILRPPSSSYKHWGP